MKAQVSNPYIRFNDGAIGKVQWYVPNVQGRSTCPYTVRIFSSGGYDLFFSQEELEQFVSARTIKEVCQMFVVAHIDLEQRITSVLYYSVSFFDALAYWKRTKGSVSIYGANWSPHGLIFVAHFVPTRRRFEPMDTGHAIR